MTFVPVNCHGMCCVTLHTCHGACDPTPHIILPWSVQSDSYFSCFFKVFHHSSVSEPRQIEHIRVYEREDENYHYLYQYDHVHHQ